MTDVGFSHPIDILTAFWHHPQGFRPYILRMDLDFVPARYRTFFDIFKKYISAHNKQPTPTVFEFELTDEDLTSAQQTIKEITNNTKVSELEFKYLSTKVAEFYKKLFFKKTLSLSNDLYQMGKIDEAIDLMSQITHANVDTNMGVEYHDEEAFRHRYSQEVYGDTFSSGFMQFDTEFGGWHPKTLSIFAGPANSGKTLWLVNITANRLLDTIRTNNKILYITLEIDADQVGRRIDASILNKSMRDIWSDREQGVREMIAASRDTYGNRVIIKEMQGYKTTPTDIEAFIHNLDVTSNGALRPNLLVIDYLGLLSPSQMNSKMGLYEKGLSIAVELRSIAQQFNIPVIAAAQTNRDSFSDDVGMDKISDSIGISQTADLMLTINRNEELDRQNQAIIYLAKSRFSKNGSKYLFSVNYENMRAEDITGSFTPTKGD